MKKLLILLLMISKSAMAITAQEARSLAQNSRSTYYTWCKSFVTKNIKEEAQRGYYSMELTLPHSCFKGNNLSNMIQYLMDNGFEVYRYPNQPKIMFISWE